MDNDTLKKIQAKVEKNAVGIRVNEAYVEGKNHFILKEVRPKEKPDHRVPVGLAKMAVDDMTGYAGRPGDRRTLIQKVGAEENEKDDFIDYIREMEAYNKEQIETSELYDESCSQGIAYEIFWPSKAVDLPGNLLTTEYKMVPTESVHLQYTNEIKPSLEYFVYFSGDKEDVLTASVYYPLFREDWTSINGQEFVLSETVEYPFTEPPICVYALNRKQQPLFEAGKPLIDAYDIVMSRSLNEVERFNSLILLLGGRSTEDFREALSQGELAIIDKILEDLGPDGKLPSDLPRYLQKDFSGVTELYENYLNRAYKDYRKVVKVQDIGSDEAVGGNVSGVSQAYKLLGMEFMAAKIDTYFNQGLEKRLDFYAQVYNAGTQRIDVNDYKAVVKTKRNLPVNILEIIQGIVQLQGIVSDRTILEYLPEQIVPDVERELERLKEQEPKNVLELPQPEESDE